MEINLDIVFIGSYLDLKFSMEYSALGIEYKAIYLTEDKSYQLENKSIKICSECIDILDYINESTLLIASNLLSHKDIIYKALDKKCHLFLLSYQGMTIKEYDRLSDYAKNRGVAFYVPIFAYSKSILLKKMIVLYTKDRILNITINDQDNSIFNSDVFLITLNIINTKNIKNIKIEKTSNKTIITTDKYMISFENDSKKSTVLKAITDDDIWQFIWNTSNLLETNHKSGMKERYSYEEENAVESLYKNMYSHCLGISPMLYVTIEDMLLYLKIRDAFLNLEDDSSIDISI